MLCPEVTFQLFSSQCFQGKEIHKKLRLFFHIQNIIFIFITFIRFPETLSLNNNKTRAATILRLLGNKTFQFSTRGKKSETGLRKQLTTDVKSTTKFIFFSLNI